MDVKTLIDQYFAALNALRDAFGSDGGFPSFEDERSRFWRLRKGRVEWAETREELESGNAYGYEADVVDGLVHRTDTFTAIAVESDSLGFGTYYAIFDNSKEIK